VDISKDSRAKQKLRREAERAKRALSSQHQVRCVFNPFSFFRHSAPSASSPASTRFSVGAALVRL
jgi:molecular chaperone DnaK (HSP70)